MELSACSEQHRAPISSDGARWSSDDAAQQWAVQVFDIVLDLLLLSGQGV